MPKPGNGKSVRWEVGRTDEYDNPTVYDDEPENKELDNLLANGPEEDEDKKDKTLPEDQEEDFLEEETHHDGDDTGGEGGKEAPEDRDPTSNGYDPYADRNAEAEAQDSTVDNQRRQDYGNQQHEEGPNPNKPVAPLERPQEQKPGQQQTQQQQPSPANGYNPDGVGPQEGPEVGKDGVAAPSQAGPGGPSNAYDSSDAAAAGTGAALDQGAHGGPGGPGQGPSSDPYDEKLGRPGENAPGVGTNGETGAPQAEGMPNQNGIPSQNTGMPGSDGTSGLGGKGGLDDGSGNGGLDKGDGSGQGGLGNNGQGGKNGSGEGQGGQGGAGGSQNGKPGGNGYGANRNGNGGRGGQGGQGADPTANARRNLGHQNRAGAGGGAGGGKPGGTGSIGTGGGLGKKGGIGSPIGNALSSLKNKLNPFNRGGGPGGNGGLNGDGENKESSGSSGFANFMKKAAEFLARHPYIAGIIIIILLIFLLCIETTVVERSSNNNNSSYSCTYNLKGVTTTGNINLDSLQVEIVNCDAKEDNYTVIETVDFEKYVVGVALAEVSWHADYPAYLQAQIVAARGFSLKRNSGMCPSRPDNCFYGYNPSTGKIRLRNCSNDQNYCDYDRPCYRKVRGEGQKALVGLEAEGQEGAYVWKGQLSEDTKTAVLAAAEEVKGKVLLDTDGNVVNTNYVNTDQQNWWALAQQGLTYDEILKQHYASQNASTMSSATCSNYGNIDYGNYVLDSSDDEILHTPLDQFLSEHGTSLEAFAQKISDNVDKAGYGTRAGVVAAAVTLIAELGNNYNVKVPYFWGGGHYDGVVDGVLGYWGSTQCHTYANNQHYNYCGFDCSGFVPWAIKNGGFNIGTNLASNFQYLSGAQKVSLSSSSPVLQPGDLLESEHHIVLVVGIDEENHQYICAEASGNARGVLFTRRTYADDGYWGVKMDGFYETHARSKS